MCNCSSGKKVAPRKFNIPITASQSLAAVQNHTPVQPPAIKKPVSNFRSTKSIYTRK